MRYYNLIILCLFLIGCDKAKNNGSPNVKIEISDTLVIENPANNHYMTFNSMVKGDTLIQMNYALRNGFHLFDIAKSEHIKEINLPNGGPKGVGLVQAFYFKSLDSLFLFNDTQIIQKGKNGSIEDIFDVKGSYKELWYPINVSNGSEAFTKDNKLFFGKNDFEKLTSNDYYKADLLMSFDLTSKIREQYDIQFPDSYLNKCWQMGQADFSYTEHLTHEDKVVFSFCAQKNLYIFDVKANKISSIKELGYNTIDEISSINCEDTQYSSRERQHYLEQPNFKYFVADKHRNVYYRFIKRGMAASDAASIRDQTRKALYRSDYILQVLNANFEPIAQKELKSPDFLVHDFFVAKEGLYISLNNPLKPDFDENTLTYAKLNLIN